MKTKNSLLKISKLLVLVALFCTHSAFSQNYAVSNTDSSLSVFGTSSLHDWEIKAETQSGSISLDTANEVPAINALDFSVVSESLKSGKSSMDKNTFEALETKDHKTIDFKLTKVNDITATADGVYNVKSTGNLTIAGTTNAINLDFVLTIADAQANIKGSYSFKMTEFKIDPPTAMFGTIKTGDELKIEFNTILK